MVVIRLERETPIELHNEGTIRHSYAEFERRNGHEVIFERRVVLAPGERKRLTLAPGEITITVAVGVVIHGL